MDDEARRLDPASPREGSTLIPHATLTPAQLMDSFQCSENVIYWELKHGCLKDIAFRVGRQWRVGADALERLLAGPAD